MFFRLLKSAFGQTCFRRFLLPWLSVLPCLNLQAQIDPGPMRMYAWLAGKQQIGDFNGVVMMKAGDSLELQGAFGWADRKNKIPLVLNDPFMIASVSKTFTATAIMKLYDEGKLGLEDKLIHWIEDYPLYQGRRVSVRNCLNHTSGIPCYMNDRTAEYYYDRIRNWKPDPDRLMRRFTGDAFKFVPGKKFSYSNSGYAVLAKVIEKVSGEPYESYISRNFLRPLNMDSTLFLSLESRHSPTHAYRFGKRIKNIPVEMAYGMGAMTSTAPDLIRWLDSFRDTVFLKSETARMMTEGGADGYGLGWEITQVGEEGSPDFQIYHGGYFPGWTSLIRWYPQEDVRLVILCNYDEVNNQSFTKPLLKIWSSNLDPEVWRPASTYWNLDFPPRGEYNCTSTDSFPSSHVTIDGSGTELMLLGFEGEPWKFDRVHTWRWIGENEPWQIDFFEGGFILRNRMDLKEYRFLRDPETDNK